MPQKKDSLGANASIFIPAPSPNTGMESYKNWNEKLFTSSAVFQTISDSKSQLQNCIGTCLLNVVTRNRYGIVFRHVLQ